MTDPIKALSSITPFQPADHRLSLKDPVSTEANFATVLKSALNQVSSAEKAADVKTELLAEGKLEDLHDVMITAQKASITVEAAVQVQQKVIDIYNEMMRMQV